jgi:hypothetical protein
MHVHHRLAPVQLLHHRTEVRVPQPAVAVAREEADAVRFERVERVFDLPQRAVHVGQRHGGKEPEPRWMIADERGAVVVARPRQAARHGRVTEPESRVGDRHHRRRHAAAVHVLDRLRRRPVVLAGCSSGRPFTSVTQAGGAK